MMYCEFIDISEYGENYITFTEYELEDLVNRTEKNTFADGFYIAMAVATGKLF